MLRKIFLIATLAIVLIGAIAIPAMANTASNLAVLSFNGDLVNNYDFDNNSVFTYDRVDQAVTIIFWGNLSTTSVSKSVIYAALDSNGFIWGGSTQYGRVNDGSGWVTNSDGGRKTDPLDLNGVHYRLYAANNSYMWEPTYWHKYLIATTHRDVWLGDPPVYGYGESAENNICLCALQHPGWTVFSDYFWFANYEPWRVEGLQGWSCDGYGSGIRLP